MEENQTLVNPYGKEIQSFKVNNEVPTLQKQDHPLERLHHVNHGRKDHQSYLVEVVGSIFQILSLKNLKKPIKY